MRTPKQTRAACAKANGLPGAPHFGLYRDSWSRRSRAPEDRGNGLDENFQIKPQRPPIDVLQIQLHPSLEGNRASSADLPETGNAGANAEAPEMPVFAEPLE